MGVFDFIVNPVRWALHLGRAGVAGAGNGTASFFRDHVPMGTIRWQLKSFESREAFDFQQLGKYFKKYAKLKRKLKRYEGKKGGVSKYAQKIANRYRNNPAVLKKVMIYETAKFADLYEELIQTIAEVQAVQADAETQQNSAMIRDEKQLFDLINSIPESQTVILLGKNWKTILKKAMKEGRSVMKQQITKSYQREQLIRGEKPSLGLRGLLLRRRGINFLAHKTFKLFRRIKQREMSKFNEGFIQLRQEIQARKISPESIGWFKKLILNYTKIMRYYHEIDEDNMLVLNHLFKDFDMITENYVAPFYSVVSGYPEARRILADTQKLKQLYLSYKVYLQKQKEYDIAGAYKKAKWLVEECSKLSEIVATRNQVIVQRMQEKLKITT